MFEVGGKEARGTISNLQDSGMGLTGAGIMLALSEISVHSLSMNKLDNGIMNSFSPYIFP